MSVWNFRPGQRVVCINDEGEFSLVVPFLWLFKRHIRYSHNLLRGKIYVVAETVMFGTRHGPVHCIRVHGADWRCTIAGIPFPAHWFRPLKTTETSIEVFEKILNGAPVEGDFAPSAGSDTFPPRAHEALVPRRTSPS